MRDLRILNNKKYEFRYRLCLEHVLCDRIVIKGIEEIGVLIDNPLEFGSIDKFYINKIVGPKDEYLLELVRRLVYINPNMDSFGIKKMTEFIVSSCVFQGRKEEEPKYTFEDFEDIVVVCIATVGDDPDIKVMQNKIVLYSKDSKLTVEQKVKISVAARYEKNHILSGEIVHNAAMGAIETYTLKGKYKDLMKVTRHKVLDNVMDRRIKTIRTLNKHITRKTVNMLDEFNEYRIFKFEKSLKKFKKFIELPEGITSKKAAKDLRVSLSTIVQYKCVKDKLKL